MARQAIRPEEVRVLDVNSAYLGVRTITLMENAGAAVARRALEATKPNERIAVICGKGNNGGDGFVAVRHLAKSRQVDLYLAQPSSEITSDIARVNFEMVRPYIRAMELLDPRQYGVIVDAMLGVGLEGRPRDPYAKYIKLLNESKRPVLSVDVPSGWPSDLHVKPSATVTFHAPKVGMTPKNSGRIMAEDIGIPADAETYCGPGDFVLLPRRRKGAHKGDSGRVLVVGGGPYTGAPAFTGMAAMRSGVDLTFVATPEPAALPVSIYSPNIIVKPLRGETLCEDHVDHVLELSKGMDVVAIGPGLGSAKETLEAVRSIVRRVDVPLVVDADAIGACALSRGALRGKTGVITPHAGEFRKLTGKTVPEENLDRRMSMVKEAASRLRMTVLLKGPTDVISDGAYVKLNRVHHEAMTVGGTGDVLTGVVAGMIAQKASPFAAARISAFATGVAGNLAFEERNFGLLATDLIEKLPFVLRRYIQSS